MKEPSYHPVADLFPMMTPDELAEMAEDIKERGLLHPVVLDADGRIVDGRNRFAACKLAKIAPAFETYEGDDAAGYALAVNIQRRNLTKGQIAMIAAKALLVSSKGTQQATSKTVGVSQQRIGQAAVVLKYAPELADTVIAGALPLDSAYEKARKLKEETEGDVAKLARLQAADPDLAAKVSEGMLSLAAAVVERQEREKRERQDREQGRAAATRLTSTLKGDVASIMLAAQLGESGLVTAQMVEICRDAAAELEKILQE